MSHSLPVVPDTTFTEREGVSYVGLAASRMGLIWREVPNTDLGIDGYLEVVVSGAPIGLIAVQIKSGSSYIEPPNGRSFTFRAKSKHVRYWLSYRLPVIIIVYESEVGAAYWHYIQDYFSEHDDVPRTETVSIRISRLALFDKSAKERLIEIASAPDSTAYAMLSLRGSRYRHTQELLTQIEMIELYGKRKWLGEWLPLDMECEQLLIHSTLARRGPAWFWFRAGANRDYVRYLESGIKHPDSYVQHESALALATVLGRRAVDDLSRLLVSGRNVLGMAEALASITDFTPDDRKRILKVCWEQYEGRSTVWSGATSLRFLSLMAKIGGPEGRERIVCRYLDSLSPRSALRTGIIRPSLLRNAGCLWDARDLPKLRGFVETEEPGLEDLAVVALAQMGEKRDCDLILHYIETSESSIGIDDIGWLSKEAAHLFGADYLEPLREMIRGPHSLQVFAHRALPDLCRRLDEPTLLKLLTDPIPCIRSYAAEGLVAIGKAGILLEYEKELLDNADYEPLIRNTAALTSAGDWTVIDRLLKSGDPSMRQGVAEGLRLVEDDRTYICLLDLLESDDIYATYIHLKAADSLSIIGNEDTLSIVLEWLLEHPYERSTNLMATVLVYLDRKLYCPIHWPARRERDFSVLRYSVTRDDYR